MGGDRARSGSGHEERGPSPQAIQIHYNACICRFQGTGTHLDHAKMLNGSRLKVRAPRENLGQRRCSGLARGLSPLLSQIGGHLMRTGYAGGQYEKIESLCAGPCAFRSPRQNTANHGDATWLTRLLKLNTISERV